MSGSRSPRPSTVRRCRQVPTHPLDTADQERDPSGANLEGRSGRCGHSTARACTVKTPPRGHGAPQPAHGRAAHAARPSPVRIGPIDAVITCRPAPTATAIRRGRRRLARHVRGFSPQLGRLPRTRRRSGKVSAGAAVRTGTCSTSPSGALKPSRGQLRRTRWAHLGSRPCSDGFLCRPHGHLIHPAAARAVRTRQGDRRPRS